MHNRIVLRDIKVYKGGGRSSGGCLTSGSRQYHIEFTRAI